MNLIETMNTATYEQTCELCKNDRVHCSVSEIASMFPHQAITISRQISQKSVRVKIQSVT